MADRTMTIFLNFGGQEYELTASILLAIDISGSMMGAPINEVKGALRELIHEKRQGDTIGVSAFGDGVEHVADFSDYSDYLEERISEIEARNESTRLYDAVADGVTWLSQEPNPLKLIVLLSDGSDNGSQKALPDCLEMARQARVKIYSIGFTQHGPESTGMKVLQQLAADTGGKYFYAPSTGQLKATFAEALQTVKRDLDFNVRKRTAETLAANDPDSKIWSRFVSIDTCEKDGQPPLNSPPNADNPFLFLPTAATTRQAMHEDFISAFIAGEVALPRRLVEIFTNQGTAQAGLTKADAMVFVVGKINDLLTLSAATQVAKQLREIKEQYQEVFGGNLYVIGLFVMWDEVRYTVEERQNLYAWLAELHTLEREIGGPWSRILLLSSNNNSSSNPEGFFNLSRARASELLVEVLVAMHESSALVQLLTSQARIQEQYKYAAVGETSLFLDQERLIEASGYAYSSDLLNELYRLPADAPRVRDVSNNFIEHKPVKFTELKHALLYVSEDEENALRGLKMELGRFWPFSKELKRLYPDRQEYLSRLPARIREYGEFVLATKLRQFANILARNTQKVIDELNGAIEQLTDGELWQTPQGHPVQAEEMLKHLYQRIAKERSDFQARIRTDADFLSTEYFTFSFQDIKVRERGLDVEGAFNDLVAHIEKMPIPEAIYTRSSFLGLISAFAVDRFVSLIPAFVLNLGPLRLPMVLGIATLVGISAFGLWWRSLAERQLSYFIKKYGMALQQVARGMAIKMLEEKILHVYDVMLKKIGDSEAATPDSEWAKTQNLRQYLSNVLSEILQHSVRKEEVSFFHVSLLDKVNDTTGRATIPVLENPPDVGYPKPNERPNWKNEINALLLAPGQLFAEWRAWIVFKQAPRLRDWLELNRPRLLFKEKLIHYARERFHGEIEANAKLAYLLRQNSQAHNALVFRRLKSFCYSPLYTNSVSPAVWRYWTANDSNEGDFPGPEIFPEMHPANRVWQYMATRDGSHLRLFTLMDFEWEDIPFIKANCKPLYEGVPEKQGLHLRDETELYDPVSDEFYRIASIEEENLSD